MHQAALETLLATKSNVAELVQLVPRPLSDDLGRLVSFLETSDAVEYLSGISLRPISTDIATSVLTELDLACVALVRMPRRDAELQLVEALRCVCKCNLAVCRPALFCAHWEGQPVPVTKRIGVDCSSLGQCIGDLLAHYLSRLIQGYKGSIDFWNGILCPKIICLSG